MSEELWMPIMEFPNYEISSHGRIYNVRQGMMMSISRTQYGNPKITLADERGRRFTRSVAQLVGDLFVPKPDLFSDSIIFLDGDLNNVRADNLAWRPRGFAWKYTRQLKVQQPRYCHNLPVYNVLFDVEYDNIIEAGTTEGVLFEDVWRSTYTGKPTYPDGSVYEVIERV